MIETKKTIGSKFPMETCKRIIEIIEKNPQIVERA